jgi:hypothetical protein
MNFFPAEVVQKIKTHILYSITFFSLKNCALYEIMRKNIAQPDWSQLTTWRMRIACWIPKSANRHSEYVILMAFPLQLWLHERVSMLRYRYIAPPVYTLCFPDGKAITPVCVLCVGPICSEESPSLLTQSAFGKDLIALCRSYSVAWHYFTNTR